MTYERLNEDERSRFIAGATGSDDSDRWLHAVLRMAITWGGDGWTRIKCDTGTARGRRRICDPSSRVVMKQLVTGISSQRQLTGVFMSEEDPMIVNAMDTLIRFAMTRHDVIGPLCSDPDAAGMMEDTIDVAERHGGKTYGGNHDGGTALTELACHMILPVIIHAYDPAEDVFDAISAGYDVSALRQPSDYSNSRMLSSCIPYEGPHCGPRLAAMWADKDAIEGVLCAETAVTPVSMLITSMPGAADIGIPKALERIRSMQPDHVASGVIPKGAGDDGICDSSLPPMDWDTYRLAMKDGAAAVAGLQLCEFTDEENLLTAPEAKKAMDGIACGTGSTWSEFSTMPEDDRRTPFQMCVTRNPSMSDMAFMVRHHHGSEADPRLSWDLLRAAMYPQRYLGCGIPRMEAVAGCALTHVPYMPCGSGDIAIRDAAIQLHDDGMLSAADLIGRIMARMKSMIPEYDDAITEVMMAGLARQGTVDRDRDDDKVVFLPLEAVERFLLMLSNGLPEHFAMETLTASVRTFRCGGTMEQGIHGIAFIVPYPHSASMIML